MIESCGSAWQAIEYFHQTMLAVKGHDYTLVSKSELHFGVQNQVTNGETVSGYHVVELGRNSPV